MAALAERFLTLAEFRERYGNEKPAFEYWNGVAIQKSMPTKLHSALQGALRDLLKELGYKAYTELTLRISPNWEPVPDVSATLTAIPGDYPDQPVEVAIEILSPDDRFAFVEEKCERYSALGTPDILVFDPVRRKAWAWDASLQSLIQLRPDQTHNLHSGGNLSLAAVWSRFEQEL